MRDEASVVIRGRFHRSVNLILDQPNHEGLGDYLLTPTTRQICKRMLKELDLNKGSRCWTITGPYGTGKSAFALFLLDILTNADPHHPFSRQITKDNPLEKPLLPVIIIGERVSLKRALVDSLILALEKINPNKSKKMRQKMATSRLTDRKIAALYEETCKESHKLGKGGILLVIDEFGKFLEYAALNEDEDLFVMQELAEVAERSENPFVVANFLHMAFSAYLSDVDDSRRSEWQKVQGRFTDIAFQEPPEQFLRLTGSAIEQKLPINVLENYHMLVSDMVDSAGLENIKHRMPLKELLPECIPFHPITALLLHPIFKSKLAQNERSLFAFLTSNEPYSFSEWNSRTDIVNEICWYNLDDMYDYITTALGPKTFSGEFSRRWQEIDYALARVDADAPPSIDSLIKCIGLLAIYGKQLGFCASKDILNLIVEDLEEKLTYLERKSIVIYRRFEGAYSLWEGSDVDLEAERQNALKSLETGNLANRLTESIELRHFVAKSHYMRTGTLRYFEVQIVEADEDTLSLAKDETMDADGRILFVISPSEKKRVASMEWVRKNTKALASTIFAFPKPISGLETALLELEIWKWIDRHVKQLEGDPVARKEVGHRITIAKLGLNEVVGRVIGLRGQEFTTSDSEWFHMGKKTKHNNYRDFTTWISEICNDEFSSSPIIHNEIINRNQISRPAAGAVKKLISKMLENPEKERLGIEGYPPEISIYNSLLLQGGFHKRPRGRPKHEEPVWLFGEPNKNWMPVWKEISKFLKTTRQSRKPITDLYAVLRSRPYGLRKGILPILLCAVIKRYGSEIALYEDGLYQPSISGELFERITRVEKSFEIQQVRLSKKSREALDSLALALAELKIVKYTDGEINLLDIVRPLVLFVRNLNDYSKITKRFEKANTALLRTTILKAKDPHALVFTDIRESLGLSEEEEIGVLTATLKDSIEDLQQAYPVLLDHIEKSVRDNLKLFGNAKESKDQLADRCDILAGYSSDKILSLLVKEMINLGNRDWREVVGRVVNNGLPPNRWNDSHITDFDVKMLRVSSDFVRLEEMVAELGKGGATKILRLGILDGGLVEARDTLAITPETSKKADELASKMQKILSKETGRSEKARQLRLAALSKLVQKDLPKEEVSE